MENVLRLVKWDELEGLAWCVCQANGNYSELKAEWQSLRGSKVTMPGRDTIGGYVDKCEFDDQARTIHVAIHAEREAAGLLSRGFVTGLSVNGGELAFSDMPRPAKNSFAHVYRNAGGGESHELYKRFQHQQGGTTMTKETKEHFQIAAKHHRGLSDVHKAIAQAHQAMHDASADSAHRTFHSALAKANEAFSHSHAAYAGHLDTEARMAELTHPTPIGTPPRHVDPSVKTAKAAGRADTLFDFLTGPEVSSLRDGGETGGL